jgi:hypothetical protein
MSASVTPDFPTGFVSPMLLADRMLFLAEQAERAGLADTAGRLVALAHTVFDEHPLARLS